MTGDTDLARLLERGLAQQRAGQHRAAIQIFELVRRRAGGDAPLLLQLGESYEAVGDLARADDAYCGAIERDPDLFPAYRRAVQMALRARAIALRAGQAETAETLRQGAGRHVAALGVRLVAHGAFREAEAEFRAAAELAPEDWACRVDLGRCLYEQGRYDLAEMAIREGLRLAPDQALAHFHLGMLLGRSGRREDAEAALRQAIALDPGLSAAAAELDRLLAE